MNEEEFLKEHPSLKGKIFRKGGDFIDENEMITPPLQVNAKDIHETQIDKQKVRDAIKKATLCKVNAYTLSIMQILKDLLMKNY